MIKPVASFAILKRSLPEINLLQLAARIYINLQRIGGSDQGTVIDSNLSTF